MTDGFTTSLLVGIAERLADATDALWRPTGTYAPTELGIVLGALRPTPDRQIALATYGVGDSPNLSESRLGVQFRTRGAAKSQASVDDIADLIFDVFHGATDLVLNDVTVVQALRKSYAPMGADNNGRFERADNYYLDVARPGTNRPD